MTEESTTSGDMPKAYDPAAVEEKLYRFWEENGYFTPKIDPAKKPFTIIMPPPNVTGELHLGHALTATLEDIMIRWHRMQGEPTLWLPGVDHAGIADAGESSRSELAQEGLTRHDLGREKFLERVWEWVRAVPRASICDQHKRLGASCDWTRERFTLDPGPAAGRAHHLRQPLQQGPDLPRRAHHQLVPALPHRPLRPRGRAQGGAGPPLVRPLPAARRRGRAAAATTSPSPPPARRPSSAIRPWP